MGIRRERIKEYGRQTKDRVIARDRAKCIACPNKAVDVHEIISKSSFGSKNLEICFSMKNRCCLCRDCHKKAQGNPEWIRKLLGILKERYGYSYEETVFKRYFVG